MVRVRPTVCVVCVWVCVHVCTSVYGCELLDFIIMFTKQTHLLITFSYLHCERSVLPGIDTSVGASMHNVRNSQYCPHLVILYIRVNSCEMLLRTYLVIYLSGSLLCLAGWPSTGEKGSGVMPMLHLCWWLCKLCNIHNRLICMAHKYTALEVNVVVCIDVTPDPFHM